MEKQTKPETIGQDDLSLTDIRDLICYCASKIGCLRDFTTHSVATDELFSDSGLTGFSHILMEVERDLNSAVDRLSKIQLAGQTAEQKRVD
ncbi:MAG: hypothetical protein ACLQGU_04340 [bacterium]